MSSINFGTDGWYAEMGGEFTFNNVRIFTEAYSDYLKSKYKDDIKIVVNFDTRFLSSKFTEEVVKVLSLNRINSFIPERDTPIPAISFFVASQKFNGALNFAGGIKKPIFNGLKILNSKGAPELSSETKKIENIIAKIQKTFDLKPQYTNVNYVNHIELRSSYIKYIENIVNLDLIRDSGLKIIVDNLYGSSRDYLDFILNTNGIETISIHNFPYSSFGNVIPDCRKKSLSELSSIVLKNNADLGLATDINGSRFGIINSKGIYIEVDKILPPLIEYLIKERKMSGGIIKSISNTKNIQNVAEYYLRKVYECPVGFKFLAEEMNKKKAFIAIDEDGGGTLNAGVKVKDGILFNLLISEMVAFYGVGLNDIINSFFSRFPRLFKSEVEIPLGSIDLNRINRIFNGSKVDLKGINPVSVDYLDGIRFIFDDSWLLIRKSGTEDFIKIYAESTKIKKTSDLIKFGRGLIE